MLILSSIDQFVVMYASTFMLVSLSIDRVDDIARDMNFTFLSCPLFNRLL